MTIVLKTKLAKNEKTASKGGGLYNFTQFYVLHNLPEKKNKLCLKISHAIFWPLFMKMDYLSQFSEALTPYDIVTF